MFNKKIITLVLIVLVVIAGIVFFSQKPAEAPAPINTVNVPERNDASTVVDTTIIPANTVVFTDNGFSPKITTISAGDSITFVNNSGSKKMWVASDPHPTHTDYPGFDEKTAVKKGGSYTFKFTKIGTWGFHNHLNPAIKGTIVVK